VAIRCFAAWSLWFLGRPDQALTRIHDALALAHETAEPHSLAHALLFAAILHQLRREERQSRDHADAAIAVSIEHGLVMYLAMATITRGWTLIEPGREEQAIEEMRRGLAALQTTGAQLLRPHFLALLAAALEKAGRADEGLRALEEALAMARSTGERLYEAELCRLKGEQLLAQPSTLTAAEDCFNQSLEIARRQKAQSLELRTVMSLARLYRHQGKPDAALDLLAHTHGRFTEGFETADLRDAKTLLGDLSVKLS
jgi:predicted ATPase